MGLPALSQNLCIWDRPVIVLESGGKAKEHEKDRGKNLDTKKKPFTIADFFRDEIVIAGHLGCLAWSDQLKSRNINTLMDSNGSLVMHRQVCRGTQ